MCLDKLSEFKKIANNTVNNPYTCGHILLIIKNSKADVKRVPSYILTMPQHADVQY